MNPKVSNCYYHVERPSVATCSKCGVGICKECAVKDSLGNVICVQCGNDILKQEHKEYRKILKQSGGRFENGQDFIIPSIIGILIIIIIILIAYFSQKSSVQEHILRNLNVTDIVAFILFGYMLFSIPFCMIMLNDLFPPKYDSGWGHFSRWYFKVAISLFLGWVVLTYYLIRFIIIRIKKKRDYNSS